MMLQRNNISQNPPNLTMTPTFCTRSPSTRSKMYGATINSFEIRESMNTFNLPISDVVHHIINSKRTYLKMEENTFSNNV